MRLPRLLIVFLVALFLAAAPNPTRATTLLPDFVETTFVGSGLSRPTAMAFAPDGRLFVTEQAGALRVIKEGALLPDPAITLDVIDNGERGLLGVAFDPDFATNQHIYLYYTNPDPLRNHISRFTMNGDVVQAGSEQPLLQLENLTAVNHNGGAIHFGKDNRLYIAVGENATTSNSQTLNNKLGKILRINRDGSIPNDNPFYNQASGTNRAIWALGLRNPFTFGVQPGSGIIYINDVGQDKFEEVNLGVRGGNYGWPLTEGVTNDPRFISPLYTYSHNEEGICSIAGGAFYNPPVRQYPPEYTGDYFFGDYCGDWIRVMDAPTGNVVEFAAGLDERLVDIQVGPDGAVYYVARNENLDDGVVKRFDYTGPNLGDELATNGSFEAGKPVPDDWTAAGRTTDKVVCNKTNRPNNKPDKIVADEANCAFRFFGAAGKSVALRQVIPGDGLLQGDILHLSAAASASKLPGGAALVRARINYADGTKKNLRVRIRAGSYGYSGFRAAPFTLTDDVTSIALIVRFTGTRGVLTVDRVSLRHDSQTALPLPPAADILRD